MVTESGRVPGSREPSRVTPSRPVGFDPAREPHGIIGGKLCRVCGGDGWVCESHPDEPAFGGCCGGAGMPCGACALPMASAAYSEPWRELADRAIAAVESAVRETNWGQPTFGPDCGEELRAEYRAQLNAIAMEARRGETRGSTAEGGDSAAIAQGPSQ